MRVKIRHLLLVLAATVTAGAVAKLSDNSVGSKLVGSGGAASGSPAEKTGATDTRWQQRGGLGVTG